MKWPWSRKQLSAVQTTVPAVANVPANGVWLDLSIGGGVKQSLDRESRAMMAEYTRSIYLWRCIDLIAGQAGAIPLYVRTEQDRTLTAPEAAVQALLERPNPQWTAQALQYFLAASLAVVNRAYLKRVRGVGGKTLELWPISADLVTAVVRPETDVLTGYAVQEGPTKRTVYPIDANGDCDIIAISRPVLNPKADRSPAAVAAPPAEVFTRILQRCADIVSNSSNVTGLLSTKSDVGETALQTIKDRLLTYRTGNVESGGLMVAGNAEWNLTKLSDDPASALNIQIKDSLARDVAMTFGVPTQLVGIPGNDTYNNMLTARVSFITETVLPGYVHPITASLGAMLLRGLPDVSIDGDTDQVPAMVRARHDLVDIAAKATMLSINEQREMMGYPRLDDELADVPVGLERMRLERLKLESGAGGVGEALAGAET